MPPKLFDELRIPPPLTRGGQMAERQAIYPRLLLVLGLALGLALIGFFAWPGGTPERVSTVVGGSSDLGERVQEPEPVSAPVAGELLVPTTTRDDTPSAEQPVVIIPVSDDYSVEELQCETGDGLMIGQRTGLRVTPVDDSPISEDLRFPIDVARVQLQLYPGMRDDVDSYLGPAVLVAPADVDLEVHARDVLHVDAGEIPVLERGAVAVILDLVDDIGVDSQLTRVGYLRLDRLSDGWQVGDLAICRATAIGE